MLMPKKLLYAIVSLTIIISALLVGYQLINEGSNQSAETWKAAIIDQLSIKETWANATFMNTSTSILRSAGYDVEIFSGQEVDVKFYESLPTRGFRIIILRAHSTVRVGSNYVDLFTSEPYAEGEYMELGDQISKAVFFNSSEEYFAIGPTFVKQSMGGSFSDAVIILMGCSGLNYTTMAEELTRKGARVILGWTNLVLPSETDYFITLLLRYLLDPNRQDTIKSANDKINLEINRKPTISGSRLRYYPPAEGNYVIPVRNESGTGATMKPDKDFQVSISHFRRDFVIAGLSIQKLHESS